MSGSASADPTARPEDAERGLFVYGVVPADADLPDGLTGLDDSPVRVVSHGRVAAVVGDIALERPPGRRADLEAYTTVVDKLAAAVPVAPVQFGTVLPDDEVLVGEFLAPSEEGLAETLAELAGRVQLNLRAAYREEVVLAEVVDSDPEVRQLRDRTRDLPEDVTRPDRIRLGELVARALEDKAGADAEFLLGAVVPHVAAYSERHPPGPDAVLDVALLVDAERREELESVLEDVAEGVSDRIRLQLVGPLPPYDFARAV